MRTRPTLAPFPPAVRRMVWRMPRKAIGDLVDRLESATTH